MTQLVPNPYFIHIELFWPDGSRPDQDEIAFVRAFDVQGAGESLQGQSGYDLNTGGWLPIYMQNIAGFFPPRERPNLRFQVVSTQSQILHTTQIFYNIAHDSTVRIIIGQGDELTGESWRVGGQVRWPDGSPITQGTIRVYDITEGSEALLGTTTISSTGNYTLTYNKFQFENNGKPHSSPNLRVRAFDATGKLLKESDTVYGASTNQIINLVVETPVEPDGYRVFGHVTNEYEGAVEGVIVRAFHIAWTKSGIQEVALGETISDTDGFYNIPYDPPIVEGVKCGSAPGEMNLILYVFERNEDQTTGRRLVKSSSISPAEKQQLVDLVVAQGASARISEYTKIHEKVDACLGETEQQKEITINQLYGDVEYRAVAARTSGVGEELFQAYIVARWLARTINQSIDWEALSVAPLDPQVIYALVRRGKGSTMQDFIEIEPQELFEILVEAIAQGFIDFELEEKLAPSEDEELPSESIQDTWSEVLAKHLGEENTHQWQNVLLALVITEKARREEIIRAYYNYQGEFEDFFEELSEREVITEKEAQDLRFIFELHGLVDGYMPIIETLLAARSTAGWETCKDLAGVSLEQWYNYAMAQYSAKEQFPGDIPGNSVTEKAHIYSQRLYDKFFKQSPQRRFVAEAKAAESNLPHLEDVVEFLEEEAETFDLYESGVDKYITDHNLVVTPEVVTALKQIQRVFRVTSDFSAAEALIEADLDSAVKITERNEGEFIAEYESLVGGLTAARDIHRKASLLASEVYSTVVRFNQNLNDTGGSPALPRMANFKLAVEKTSEVPNKFPNWVTLFGSLYNEASKHCQTVLSPGAYLVDLLHHFLSTSTRELLLERRPDLVDMELTCPNTDRAVPYIDLVNEILSTFLAAHEVPLILPGDPPTVLDKEYLNDACDPEGAEKLRQVLSILEAAGYSLTERALLKQSALYREATPQKAEHLEWVIEDDSWRFTVRAAPEAEELESEEEPVLRPEWIAYGVPQTQERSQELDVFPEHSNEGARQILGSAVFPFQLPLDLSREEMDLLVEQRGVSRAQILQTFRVDLEGTARWTDLEIATAHLHLTAAERAAILARELPVYEYWGFTGLTDPEETLTIPRPESPNEKLSGTWEELLANVSVFLHRSQLTYAQLQDLVDTRFIHDPTDSEKPVTITGEKEDIQEANYFRFTLENLTPFAAQRISFFLRLQRKLGWSFRELDWYLTEWVEYDEEGAEDEAAQIFVPLAQLSQWAQSLSLKPQQLMGCYAELDQRRTERFPVSVFDEVYLRGASTSPVYRALDGLARGEELRVQEAELPAFINYLRGALRLSKGDFEVLWGQFVEPLPPTSPEAEPEYELTVALLSRFFAVAEFSRAVRVSVAELFVVEPLFGFSSEIPGADFLEGLQLLEELRRLQATGLAPRLWNYLLRHQVAAGDSAGPSVQEIQLAYRRLAEVGGEILARYPVVAVPNAETLGAGLAERLSANRVARVLEILQAPIGEEDALYLEESLGFFLGEDTEDEVLALVEEPDPELRYARLDARLRPYLVESAKNEAVLRVVSELFSLRPERIEVLLNSALRSVEDPEALAWDDWLGALGGWSDGVIDLVDQEAGERKSHWIVPADGAYRLVTRGSAETATGTLSLQVAGEELVALPPQVKGDEIWVTWGVEGAEEGAVEPLSCKAQSVLPVEFSYTGEGRVSLLVAQEENDPVPLPGSSLSPLPESAYLKLWKAAAWVQGMKLAEDELRYLVEEEDLLVDGENLLNRLPLSEEDEPLPWSAVRAFLDQVQLNRRVGLTQGSLMEHLLFGEELTSAELSQQTGWEEADIVALYGLWDQPPSLLEVNTWFVLESAQRLVQSLDLPAAQVMRFLLSAPTTNAVEVVRSALRSLYSLETWRAVFKPLRDRLRQRERDALVGYLTTRNLREDTEKGLYFFDANDLFAYLLIDVQMEPDTEISRIRLALNSIQLYVERALMGLEAESAFQDLRKMRDQWEWMKNYRVWEANRKIFLFPENWIEPELRDDKTELFRELEEELLQNDISDQRAEQVLSNYLERLGELSDLQVVGACQEGKFSAGTGKVLHIIARTRAKPYHYYHRRFEFRQYVDGAFSPWNRIPLEIEADWVAPALAEGRLRIIWLSAIMKEKVAKDTGSKEGVQSKLEMRLLWSTYDSHSGNWSKPHMGQSKVFDNYPLTVFERDEKDDGPDLSCYHMQTEAGSEGDVIVGIYKTVFPKSFSESGNEKEVNNLYPTVLGKFTIRASGEDLGYTNTPHLGLALGDQLPRGMALVRNASVSLDDDVQVEGVRRGYSFGFLRSRSFFHRVNAAPRSLVTNFGYVWKKEPLPFFFEVEKYSLFGISRGGKVDPGFSSNVNQYARFLTFNHPVLADLRVRFNAQGPTGIMQRRAQALPVSSGRYYYSNSNANSRLSSTSGSNTSGYNNAYNAYYAGLYKGYHIAGDKMAWGAIQREFHADLVASRSVETPFPLPTVDFSYGSSYGVYNWELFFHLPILVAQRLSQEMRFSEAMKWYHYVFDPRLDLDVYEKTKRWAEALPFGSRYWNFLPFFANKDATDSLLDIFGAKGEQSWQEREELKQILDAWRQNPFSPHLIARQRPAAYQKFVVMKYLDNLIAWADQLFRQDTFESINQATQLYVLADELLGKRPEIIEPLTTEPRYTYRELAGRSLSNFSNALVEVESLLVTTSKYNSETPDDSVENTRQAQNTGWLSLYFKVPRNDRLDAYWDTVQDRLFKIRNSMNIDGVKRTLALYEPPIDPALLVKAHAAGLDLGSVLSQLQRPLPFYRFQIWSQKATELVSELKSFGGALLAALEKKDAEDLALLRQDHEIRMLNLIRQVRRDQLREAEENLTALQLSRKLAEDRLEDYSSREFMSEEELRSMSLTQEAGSLEKQAGTFNLLASIMGMLPQVSLGAFSATMEMGGLHLSGVFSAIASGMNVEAGVKRNEASLSSQLGGYLRRQEDWDLQIRQAELEMKHIDQQLVAAEVRVAIAEKELDNHEVQMEQANEMRDFMREKFTNRELYQWMVTQLSRTYQQVYQLAYDVTKTAERTFQFELGVTDTDFVKFGYMDSLRQGLLAGEALGYDLKRMEVAYLERNKREFELTKSISLAQINPYALQQLRETGSCEFSLPEILFDLDHPGHYFRRIRAVRLTIPCVTGPYTNVSAQLSLLSSAIRVQATADASDYPYRGLEDPRFRHDVGGIQSVATSTSQDDAGLFELNFKDERYLPFEGAGAISRFRLELPEAARQFDYQTISDVVITLNYTARNAGGSLKKAVTQSLEEQLNHILELVASESGRGLWRAWSMKREFPDALHQLLTAGSTELALLPEHFSYLLRQKGYQMSLVDGAEAKVDVHVQLRQGVPSSPWELKVAFGEEDAVPVTLSPTEENLLIGSAPREQQEALLPGWTPETWRWEQAGLQPADVEDIVFLVKYELQA